MFLRILAAILFPLAIVIAEYIALHPELGVVCVFHELTGMYCPGCGSSRAIASIVRGDIGKAFRFNPLVFLLGFPALGITGYEYLRFVFPRLGWKPVVIGSGLTITATVIVLLFWILRNIPAFSFLAP